MAEYSKTQRNQLSRAIANSGAGSKQLKRFVDNRCIVDNIIQKKEGNQLSLKDIEREDIDAFQKKIEQHKDSIKSDIETQKNRKWEEIDGEPAENIHHTIGRMIDLNGNIYKGFSTPASEGRILENKKISTVNQKTICAEQYILDTFGGDNRYVFSLAKDGEGLKPACKKCASNEVLGKHNIIDACLGGWNLFSERYNVAGVYDRKSKYIAARDDYQTKSPGTEEVYVKKQVKEKGIVPQYTSNSRKAHKDKMKRVYETKIAEIKEEYNKLLKEWQDGKPKIEDY